MTLFEGIRLQLGDSGLAKMRTAFEMSNSDKKATAFVLKKSTRKFDQVTDYITIAGGLLVEKDDNNNDQHKCALWEF